jgi:hypothetical protein
VFIQAFLAQARIEALDVGVLDRLARFDKLQPYAFRRPTGRAFGRAARDRCRLESPAVAHGWCEVAPGPG